MVSSGMRARAETLRRKKKEKWQKRDAELNQAVLAYLLGVCLRSEKWAQLQGGQQISEAWGRRTYGHSAEDMHRNEGPPPSKTLPRRAGPGWAPARLPPTWLWL